MINKEYMLKSLNEQYGVLRNRYIKACYDKNEQDKPISAGTAQQIRTKCKRDKSITIAFIELIQQCGSIELSEEALEGVLCIAEPLIRHRAIKIKQ